MRGQPVGCRPHRDFELEFQLSVVFKGTHKLLKVNNKLNKRHHINVIYASIKIYVKL